MRISKFSIQIAHYESLTPKELSEAIELRLGVIVVNNKYTGSSTLTIEEEHELYKSLVYR